MANSTPLKPGTILESQSGRYTVLRVLGTGGFGITYLVEGTVRVQNIPVKVRFALKEHFIDTMCSRDPVSQRVVFDEKNRESVTRAMRAFVQEATRLHRAGVEHSNIVRINEVFEANNTAYYVMEYLEGETLADYIKARGPMSPSTTFKLFRPIIDAVARLHDARITHYDIKPGNIILARTESRKVRPVLIDFGLSRQYNESGNDNTVSRAMGYSVGYSPIEQYAGIRQFTPQADVYALAASILFCLTGEKPLGADRFSVADIIHRLSGFVPQRYIDALMRAMTYDREGRTVDAGVFYSELYDEYREQTRIVDPLPPRQNDFDSAHTRFMPGDTDSANGSVTTRLTQNTVNRTEITPIDRDDDEEESYGDTGGGTRWWIIVIILLLLAILGVCGYYLYKTYHDDNKGPGDLSNVEPVVPETPFQKALRQYDGAGELIDGIAMVSISRDTVVYNSDGSESTFRKTYYGFIDEQGRVVVPCKYTGADPYQFGFARVNGGDYAIEYDDYGNAKLKLPPRYGYVDRSGREVVVTENGFCSMDNETVSIKNNGVTQKFPLSEIYNYKEYLAEEERKSKLAVIERLIHEVENLHIEPYYTHISLIKGDDYDNTVLGVAINEFNSLAEIYNENRTDYFQDDEWTLTYVGLLDDRKNTVLNLLENERDLYTH